MRRTDRAHDPRSGITHRLRAGVRRFLHRTPTSAAPCHPKKQTAETEHVLCIAGSERIFQRLRASASNSRTSFVTKNGTPVKLTLKSRAEGKIQMNGKSPQEAQGITNKRVHHDALIAPAAANGAIACVRAANGYEQQGAFYSIPDASAGNRGVDLLSSIKRRHRPCIGKITAESRNGYS